MVPFIVGHNYANNALSGLLLCGSCLRVISYIRFDQNTQCSLCVKVGHQQVKCKESPCCAICAGQHLTHLHTCKHPECKTKGTACLHSSTLRLRGTQRDLPEVPLIHHCQTSQHQSRELDVSSDEHAMLVVEKAPSPPQSRSSLP